MDHSVYVAGEKQKDFRRLRGDHAGDFNSRAISLYSGTA